MRSSDLSSIARWPDVPACYGWLSLDRRGGWRLQGEVVTHAGLIAFMNHHYDCDDAGRWFVQNGPQRVFVALEYTPLVLRLEGDGGLVAHTGAPAGTISTVHLDDEGSIVIHTALGVGVLDDRDLAAVFSDCHRADGSPASDEDLLDVMRGGALGLVWRGKPLQTIGRDEVAAHFGFEPNPAP
jgi:hypothetical protein